MVVAVPGLRNVTAVTFICLTCHISYDAQLYHANRTTDTCSPNWIRNETDETPPQPVPTRHNGNRSINIKRRAEDMA